MRILHQEISKCGTCPAFQRVFDEDGFEVQTCRLGAIRFDGYERDVDFIAPDCPLPESEQKTERNELLIELEHEVRNLRSMCRVAAKVIEDGITGRILCSNLMSRLKGNSPSALYDDPYEVKQ